MKTANDFTCSIFNENIRAFIDDELPINQKSVFLKHSSICDKCKIELLHMQKLKKELACLKRVTVSPEFDFKVKSLIRHEHENLRNPLYLFKLFLIENKNKFIAVPAFSLLILASLVFYNNSFEKGKKPFLPDVVTNQINAEGGVELIPENQDSSVEVVNYVMETVKPTEMELGILVQKPDGTVQSVPINNNINLVSF